MHRFDSGTDFDGFNNTLIEAFSTIKLLRMAALYELDS